MNFIQKIGQIIYKSFWGADIAQAGDKKNLFWQWFGSDDINRNPANLAREAYVYSCVAYSAIDKIAKAVSSIKVEAASEAKDGSREIKTNLEISKFLKKVNARDTWQAFIRRFVYNYFLYGNVYNRVFLGSGRKITEMHILNSLNVSINETAFNEFFPRRYQYTTPHGIIQTFDLNPLTGLGTYNNNGYIYQLAHYKTFNPFDEFKGQSPLDPIAIGLNMHTKGLRWNHATLDSSGVPSGLLSSEQPLNPAQFEQLSNEVKESWAGTKKGRGLMILEAGLKFQQLSLSPLDMDFLEQNKQAAIYIYESLGVPSIFINPDNASYNNIITANEFLYENTAIPLLELILSELNMLTESSYPGQKFVANLDSISALEGKRKLKFERMIKAKINSLVSINEARAELGFDERTEPEADEILIPANQVPLSLASIDDTLNNIKDPVNNQNNGENQDE